MKKTLTQVYTAADDPRTATEKEVLQREATRLAARILPKQRAKRTRKRVRPD